MIKTVVLNIMTYFMLLNFFVISINVSDAGVCFAKMYCTAAIVKSAVFTMSIMIERHKSNMKRISLTK